MINTTETLLLFTKEYDKTTRRTAYRAHRLEGVSAHEVTRNTENGGFAAKERVMSVRVPMCTEYTDEATYDAQADKATNWTVHTQDFFIILTSEPETIEKSLYENEIETIAKAHGYHARAYKVTEYADNSRRGTPAAQHIRIIGE